MFIVLCNTYCIDHVEIVNGKPGRSSCTSHKSLANLSPMIVSCLFLSTVSFVCSVCSVSLFISAGKGLFGLILREGDLSTTQLVSVAVRRSDLAAH